MNNKYKLLISLAMAFVTLLILRINNNDNIYNNKIYETGEKGQEFIKRLHEEVPQEDIDKLVYAIKKYGKSWKEGEVTVKEALALVEHEVQEKEHSKKQTIQETSAGERTENAIINNSTIKDKRDCSDAMKRAGWC